MKNILFLLLFASTQMIHAQGFEAKKVTPQKDLQPSCSPFYMGTSTGVNNPYGALSINMEIPLKNQFTIAPGFGLGTWGNKFGVVLKYYTKPCCLGWAYGMGLTHSRGVSKFDAQDVETIYNGQTIKKTVSFKLFPQTNLTVNAYRYWKVRTSNRFYVHFGLSLAMSQNSKYLVTSADVITDNAKNSLKAISPGGLSFGFGYQFGSNPQYD